MSEEQILISVLIPVHNAEKWIADTLRSILNQSWKNLEIIVVDDGSTDNSLNIVKQNRDSRIKVFHQENKGGSAARNLAFAKSCGEFIQYLDADDLLDKYKIERQMPTAKTDQLHLISGSYYIFSKNVKKSYYKNEIAYRNYKTPFEWAIENFAQKTMFSPNCWLIPRKLILKAGPWNTQLTYNDDAEFFIRLALNASQIIYVKNAISYYRKENANSVSSRKDKKALQSRLLCLNLNSEHLLNKRNTKEIKQVIAEEYAKFIFSIYPLYKELRKTAWREIKTLNVIPENNFFSKRRLTGKVSRLIGWKTVKLIQYSHYRIKSLIVR